jgi:ABC-type antimicrobial peptide transport system permease subunit
LLLAGGSLGLLAAAQLIRLGQKRIGSLELSGTQIVTGVALMLVTGCLVGWFPARRAARLSVVDAIRTERR